MKKEDYTNEQGLCPKRKSGNLDYFSQDTDSDMIWYCYKCKDCGQEGEEWYRLDFQGHNIYDENGEMIEL